MPKVEGKYFCIRVEEVLATKFRSRTRTTDILSNMEASVCDIFGGSMFLAVYICASSGEKVALNIFSK